MYLPKHFAPPSPSSEALKSLIQEYPLAQVVTVDEQGQWVCNPIPLMLKGSLEAGSSLVGHVARANPLWRHEGSVLVVFTGPQAYVTPNAYASKAEHHRVVPTYNYATVQVRGQLVAHDQTEVKLDVVSQLTNQFEQHQPKPWSVTDAPEDYLQATLRAIVAFEIRIESVMAKFKLSQNRTVADRTGVMDYFASSVNDSDAAAMLKMMQACDDSRDDGPTSNNPTSSKS